MFRWLLVLCYLVLPLAAQALSKDTQLPVYDWRPLRHDALGAWAARAGLAPEHQMLGTTISRLPVRWKDTQPTAQTGCTGDEPYDWTTVANDIDTVAATGLSIVLTLRDQHPCFVNQQDANGKEIDGLPNNMTAYTNWVAAVVQEFYPEVRYFQISNEVYNFPSPGWAGTLEDYRTLLRAGSDAIRGAAPEAKVVAAGFASNLYVNANPPTGLCLGLSDLMMSNAIKPCQGLAMLIEEASAWDFLDYHVYRDIAAADDIASWLQQTLAAANVQGKHIMATEAGGPDKRDGPPFTLERQAWEVAQRPSLTLGSGFDRFLWFHIKTPVTAKQTFRNMSLLDPDDGSQRPAFNALQQFLGFVGTARGIQRIRVNGNEHQTYLYRWDRPSSSIGVAWSWDGTPLSLPPAFQGQPYYDVFGTPLGTTSTTVTFSNQEHVFIDHAPIPEVPVPVRSLVMKDDSQGGKTAKRKFRFRVRTTQEGMEHRVVPPDRGSAGDPRENGAILTVYNSAGSGEIVSVALPPAGWQALGRESNPRGYRFRDKSRTGPVQRVVVKPDTIRIRAGKSDWLYTLDEPTQGRIAVRLRLGTAVQWCADVPPKAAPTHDRQDFFRGEPKTPAPPACPPVPDGMFCQATGALPAPPGTDRTITLDAGQFTPYPDPNPLRAFNIAQEHVEVGNRLDAINQTFGSARQIPSARSVRLEFSLKHWPDLGFDDPVGCHYLGVQAGTEPRPSLDKIIESLFAEGDDIMLRMSGTPASLSSDCDPVACAGRMRRGGGCTCNHPANGLGGYSSFAPRAYDQAFNDFWGCVVKHYAQLGVRRFEIWNEPDVPGSFSPNPNDTSSQQAQFIEMFEQMRVALEHKIATDPVLRAIAGQIKIGGPAVSQHDGAFPGRNPLLPTLLARVDQDGGELDFVSFHMYVSDPGGPFAAGIIDEARSFIPAGWANTQLRIDEWQTALGDHSCQLQADGASAPEAGTDSSVTCDHRGAGYAAYSLAGFLASGTDVTPYVFDMFERNDLAPDDFYETAMGLMTAHLLPKPEAGVFWAAAQMRNNLLGARIETTTDRSFGWIAAQDQSAVIHVLLSQFDSDGKMHFTRSYRAAGFRMDALAAACGCTNTGDRKEQNQCLRAVLDQIAASPDRSAELASLCPALGSSESAAVVAGLAASDARGAVRGTPMTVGVAVNGLACGAHQVDVYEMGPGATTTAAFRATHAAPPAFGDFNTLYSDNDWLGLQHEMWTRLKTPTQSYTAVVGRSLPAVKVPAYGAVYLRIQ
ncbi:MAG: hypothetical protein ACE5I7_05565 [Candidatus Binatia bacterium]